MRKLIERASGEGPVVKDDGSRVSRTRYDLEVWQEMLDAGSETLPGLREVVGTVDLQGVEMFGLMGENLVLRLEDGRRFKFFLTDLHGTVAPRGGLEEPTEA